MKNDVSVQNLVEKLYELTRSIKYDVKEMKQDIAEIKVDIIEIKEEIKKLKTGE